MELQDTRTRRVRVPASTSNLGPGFDAVGLALELWHEVRATPRPDASEHSIDRRGASSADWSKEEDLLLLAFERARKRLGGSGSVHFEVHSEIPVGRGLGSSGAAIAAGLLLAESLAPRRASREQLLATGLDLEGHPDNLAPALEGGCVLCVPRSDGAARIVPLELHASLGYAVAWPEASLSTRFARTLLPASVPHGDAVDGARRLAALIEGLRCGDAELIAAGRVEHLHVPHRLPHVPGGREALTAAHAAGAHLATISGSGTALFAVTGRERAQHVAQAMRDAFVAAGAGGDARAVDACTRASRVELEDAAP